MEGLAQRVRPNRPDPIGRTVDPLDTFCRRILFTPSSEYLTLCGSYLRQQRPLFEAYRQRAVCPFVNVGLRNTPPVVAKPSPHSARAMPCTSYLLCGTLSSRSGRDMCYTLERSWLRRAHCGPVLWNALSQPARSGRRRSHAFALFRPHHARGG